MTIVNCNISEKELCIAVQAFLKTQGVDMPVQKVTKTYRSGGGYDVEFEEPEPAAAPPSPGEMAEKEIPA
jgi:hypothetical protein